MADDAGASEEAVVSYDSVLSEQIAGVADATRRLLASLDEMGGVDPGRPSLCPGWTAGHVLTHLARNADGLRRSVEGARRGKSVPMYDSEEARDRDIEAGADRLMTELVDDVASSAYALRETWEELRPADWSREMLHRAGPRPVRDTLAMRRYEVEIHHVDLGGEFGPTDWPADFVKSLLPGEGELARRAPDGVGLDVRATDTRGNWSSGPGGSQRVVVSGPAWALACWLVGRPGPAAGALSVTGGDLPVLKP
jgi:maleylpyruvate isomerase